MKDPLLILIMDNMNAAATCLPHFLFYACKNHLA